VTSVKTAIVHDWLMGVGGAEKVLEEMLTLFPSPVFTLYHNQKTHFPDPIAQAEVHASFLQNLPLANKLYRNYLPLYPRAIESFDLAAYDLILSSSHAVAKGVQKNPDQLHICYCHTPMRYIWDLEEQYLTTVNPLKAFLAKLIFKKLRAWDSATASRVDYFIANSKFIAERIRRVYGKEATVIYPPVATHLFTPERHKDDFYLSLSRLVPYKRIDLIIDAFNQTPHRRLKIVGSGPLLHALKQKAGPNIELLGFQSDETVRTLFARAKGFIFAAVEDFGIAPVEAQAAGTPVIAYGRGGALETVVPGKTGLFFSEQKRQDLLAALEFFETRSWDSEIIASHAAQFSTARFRKEFSTFINTRVGDFS